MYAVKKLNKSNFEVVNILEEPKTYKVSKNTQGHYQCDCMGFARQKNKLEHKHCLMVQVLEDLDYDSFVLDTDREWKIVSAHTMQDAIDSIESFIDRLM